MVNGIKIKMSDCFSHQMMGTIQAHKLTATESGEFLVRQRLGSTSIHVNPQHDRYELLHTNVNI
jgi:hypothetical protein